MFRAGFRLEVLTRSRGGMGALGALGFLAVALTAVGLTLGQYPERLRPAGPSIAWAMTVLVFIFANADWWLDQVQSGFNQRLRVSGGSLTAFVLGRLVAGALAALPWFLIASWLTTLFFSQSAAVFLALCLGFLLALPALISLASFIAVLRVLLGGLGVFVGAIALPLALPLIVMGVSLTESLSLSSCALMAGVALVQSVVFAVTTRWTLSLL